jgi:uncharacterized repeat protein (TIGR02543 family)
MNVPTMCLSFLALLGALSIGVLPATADIVFPNDVSVINVKTAHGAVGNGVADDTAALQAGINASANTKRILYIPNGTYRVTNTLSVNNGIGPWIYGQSRAGVIIKLDDGRGAADPTIKSVLRTYSSDTGSPSADYFMRNVRHLTINVGNNPTVDGVRWFSNNTGALQDVTITGNGRTGVNSGFLGQNGPNMVQDVTIDGFDIGIDSQWNWSQTISRVTIRNCRTYGIYVSACGVAIEDLVVENTPIGIYNDVPVDNGTVWYWWAGTVSILNGTFTGSNIAQPAIYNRGTLYAKNVTSTGHSRIITSQDSDPGHASTGNVNAASTAEYTSSPADKLFSNSTLGTIGLPIKREPIVPWETDLSKWVCANDYGVDTGGVEDNDAPALQAAIDAAAAAGKTVVYLRGVGGAEPNWHYITSDVRVHGSVRMLIGLGWARMIGSGKIYIDETSANVVEFRHIQAFGATAPAAENRSTTKTLYTQSCDMKIIGSGGGDIFLTDCASRVDLNTPGQSMWARQLNPEGDSDSPLILNHGANLWALGMKCEGRGIRVKTETGGVTDMFGMFNYHQGLDLGDNRPAFDIDNASLSVTGIRELTFGARPYYTKFREKRGTDERVLQYLYGTNWPLYTGWNDSTVNPPPASLNKPVVASSTAGGTAAAAVDGNLTSRWTSNSTDNEWLFVDLGANFAISRVKLNWDTSFGSDYDIQVADSGSGPWTTVRQVRNGDGGLDDLNALSAAGRYVRLLGIARSSANGYSLFEFGVYGTPIVSGSITRELWKGINGTSISAIPLGSPPTTKDTLTLFETPSNSDDNYGQRVSGYLIAPTTGSYTFWIATDDDGQLKLSPSENPAAATVIASVSGDTASRQWDKFPSQKSASINLIAGQLYYIEALHKEGVFGDNFAVGWSKPGQSTSAPSEVIPASALFNQTNYSIWQLSYFSAGEIANPSLSGPGADFDADGLTNYQEFNLSTHPKLPDTDGDGFSDSFEVSNFTDPTDANSPGTSGFARKIGWHGVRDNAFVNPAANAGFVPQLNFNSSGNNHGGSPMSNLKDDTDTGTTLDVAWTGNSWGGNNGGSSNDWKLLHGSLEGAGITLSQIPYAKFDLYVYLAGEPGRAGSVRIDQNATNIASSNRFYFTSNNSGANPTSWVVTTDIDPAGANPTTNYAKFTGVIRDGAQDLVLTSDNGNAGIAGFQIVEATASITVAYDGNGSDGGSVPVDGNTYTSGGTVTVLGNTGSLTKTGYTFAGWNTAANGGGTSYNPAAIFNITSSTTLYAKWVLAGFSHFAITGITSPQTAGTAITGFTITAQDSSNNTVTGYTAPVTFGGTAGVSGISPAFINGQCTTASVTPTVAGSGLTFTVNDGAGHTGTFTITTINPGVMSQLVIAPNTIATATAGTPFALTSITAKDANGNICSSGPNAFTGAVSFSGTAGVTGTSAAFSAGVLTSPSVTATSAGSNKTIIATAGAVTATATITTVSTGAAATIALASGNNQNGVAGTVLNSPFVITVTDANANPVSGASVTFAVTTVPASATGQSLSVTNTTTATNGQASTTLTLGNLAGTYTVTATSSSLAGSSVTFTAHAAPAPVVAHSIGWQGVRDGHAIGASSVIAGLTAVEQTNWNQSGNNHGGSPMDNVKNNGGTATTLDVSWAGGTWGSTGTPAIANARLLRGALENGVITLAQIPYAQFDVYVYLGGQDGRPGSIRLDDCDDTDYPNTFKYYYTAMANPTNPVVWTQTLDTSSAGTNPTANYAVFSNVTRDSDGDIQIKFADGNAGIAGFQIVEIPVVSGYGSWATANAGNQAANLDFDLDGVPNGIEYFMGQTGSGFTANPGVVDGKVRWPHSAAATGVTHQVMISENLVDWADVTGAATDSGGFVEYIIPETPPQRFVRLKVVVTP